MRKITIIIIAIVIFVIAGIAIFWDTTEKESRNKSVSIANKAGLGEYLIDGDGKTLYYFTNDSPGKSNCAGQCIILWPKFYAKNLTVKGLLKQSDFETIKRDDGSEQIIYKGWPLYYYSKNTNAGDILGRGTDNAWDVMRP